MIIPRMGNWETDPTNESTQKECNYDLFPESFFDNLHPDLQKKLQRLFCYELYDEKVVDLTPGCLPTHRG